MSADLLAVFIEQGQFAAGLAQTTAQISHLGIGRFDLPVAKTPRAVCHPPLLYLPGQNRKAAHGEQFRNAAISTPATDLRQPGICECLANDVSRAFFPSSFDLTA